MNSYHSEEVYEYLRKSRSDDPCLSVEEVLEKHERILRGYAENYLTGKIPEENIFREVASSETIDGRPEMLRLLRGIESPEIKAILVVEVQRLSRGDLEDAGRLIKLLRYTDTKVITPQKTYDLHDEYDRDIFERELKRGNEYLEYFKKIQARGRLSSVQEGNYIGSVPPYGYQKIWIADGKKKCPTLEENAQQADIVRMIFDMYVNKDMGAARIANYLDSTGIKPPRGPHWSAAAIQDMLQNVHYTGRVRWNRRKTVNVVENQQIKKTRPKTEQYLVFEGKHSRLISDELFEAAQKKRGRNHRTKSTATIQNPLAGLLFCRCGRAMSLRTYKKQGISLSSGARFVCDNQSHCHTGSVTYSEMMDCIYQVMETSVADFEIQIKNSQTASLQLCARLVGSLEQKLTTLEEKEWKQWETYSEGNMPKNIFDRLNEKVLKEQEETRKALCKARSALPEKTDCEEKIMHFSDALAALANPGISAGLKNHYLKNIFERITYYRDKPVRITRRSSAVSNAEASCPATGGNWYSPPFEADISFRK